MTKDVIDKLPDILKKHISTLKKTSLDDSGKINMSESNLKVINFDKIPNEYSKGKGWACVPNSNDALYISADGIWYFIEFKNGSIDKSNLFRKLYDSIIMLIEMNIIPNLDYSRKVIRYILVCNSTKHPKLQEAESRTKSFGYIMTLAKEEEKLFDIEKFEKYLLKETHSYSKELFHTKFVLPMEKKEGILTVW